MSVPRFHHPRPHLPKSNLNETIRTASLKKKTKRKSFILEAGSNHNAMAECVAKAEPETEEQKDEKTHHNDAYGGEKKQTKDRQIVLQIKSGKKAPTSEVSYDFELPTKRT